MPNKKQISEKQLATARAQTIENNIFAVIVTEPDPDHDPAMQLAPAGIRPFMNHANPVELRRTARERQPGAAAPRPIPINELRTRTAPIGSVFSNCFSAHPAGSLALPKAA